MPKSDPSPELARAKRGGRRYPYPPEDPIEEFPAVSTILNHKAKPQLSYWAAREVANYAVNSKEEWASLPPQLAVKLLKGVPWEQSQASAGVGTGVHNAIQYYYQDGLTLEKALAAVVADDAGLKKVNLESYVLPGLKFVEERLDEILFQEVTLYNPTDKYAGTVDLMGKTRDGVNIILDWKTGSGLYDEVGYQLTAYCACTEIGLTNYTGQGPAISRVKSPDCTHGVAVRLGGYEYEARIIPFTEELFASFLGLRAIQTWNDLSKEWYSQKIKSDTYESPITPEDPQTLPDLKDTDTGDRKTTRVVPQQEWANKTISTVSTPNVLSGQPTPADNDNDDGGGMLPL